MEEAYEVLDALESGAHEHVCGELGDLLFHIVFLARIFEESGLFNVEDVISGIVEKMTHRHPHVFGETQVDGVEGVKAQWQEIKAAESDKKSGEMASLVHGVPPGLPALMRAYRLGERAARAGLSRPDVHEVVDKIDGDLKAFKSAMDKGNHEEYGERLGDLLFAMTDLGRSVGVHPETALGLAVSKFTRRFECVEKLLGQQGRTLGTASREEVDAMWKKCKRDE
jgi:MazG family protein